MEFDIKTKSDLKELVQLRMDKEIDEEYLHLLTEIINGSSAFDGKVVTRYNSKVSSFSASYERIDIAYNIEGFKNYFSKAYKAHKAYFDGNLKQFYGYWFPFSFIHELTHIYQMLCDKENISEFADVNDLYSKVIGAFNSFRKIDRMIYLTLHDRYSHERNANIVSSTFLAETFADTELDYYAKLKHINYLIANGYFLKKDKVISPIEKTFKYLRIKDKVEEVDLPFKVLFEHGFKISDDDFHYIYDEVVNTKGPVEYDDVVGRVKALIKRDDNY